MLSFANGLQTNSKHIQMMLIRLESLRSSFILFLDATIAYDGFPLTNVLDCLFYENVFCNPCKQLKQNTTKSVGY